VEPAEAQVALTLPDAMRRARALHQHGDLAAARRLCLAVLEVQPDHYSARVLLGVITAREGDLEQAHQLLRRAVDVRADLPEAHFNLGVVLEALSRPDEALASYDKALAVNPEHVEALNNRGNVLCILQRAEEALASYDNALAIRPATAQTLFNRGNALQRMQRYEEALGCYARALALNPAYADAHGGRGVALLALNRLEEALASCDQALAIEPERADSHKTRGSTLFALGRREEALASYERALAIRPDDVRALYERGLVLQSVQRLDEAVASYDRALAVDPGRPEVHNSRGVALQALGRLEQALASYERAIAIEPGYADAQNNCGGVLIALGRPGQALAAIDVALALRPGFAEALNNRGIALHALNRPDEALSSYDDALATRDDLADAHFNRALTALLLGQLPVGWEGYEWRWKCKEFGAARDFEQPLWRGAGDVRGKSLLLHAEQGLGDTIQFSRYATLVAARGARVILEVQPPLKSLLHEIDGIDDIVARGDPLPQFDLHCPLLSLPLALATTLDSIPSPTGNLKPDAARVARWATRLGPRESLRVGLAWSGGARHRYDRQRSIPLALFEPLLALPLQFVCLQTEIRASDHATLQKSTNLLHFEHEIVDFCDTSALIELVDLVLCVDTSVAHLAATQGKPVWLLLPQVPDWRWMLQREDSPWYPTMRIFRQHTAGGWSEVIERVARELLVRVR